MQNHAEEINEIINHANMESKYESIFNAIDKEWESSSLKVKPV
jgi:hypothetical protein